MGNSPRYKVQTRYGWFSLDEGSYRDYLSGKLQWIDWPPVYTSTKIPKAKECPPNISEAAMNLREKAAKKDVINLLHDICGSTAKNVSIPYKDRMRDLEIYELSLSVRSSNALMRADIKTYEKLNQMISYGPGLGSIRNLGVKSEKEIYEVFLQDCYRRLLPYEKALFWQDVLDKNLLPEI